MIGELSDKLKSDQLRKYETNWDAIEVMEGITFAVTPQMY